MKKLSTFVASALIAVLAFSALTLAGCGSEQKATTNSSADSKTIKVGASPTPHAGILKQIQQELEKQGYKLEVVEYNDYILPNTALEQGELDANYFQHITYLNDFNAENGTHLSNAAAIHFEPFGLYSNKISSLDAITDGAKVAVPNDTTNEARALLLLEQEGLIKLREGAGLTATVLDIVENPKNLNIQEVEAAQVPRVLPEVDLAAINGNYALNAGLKIADAIAVESDQGQAAQAYANVIAVKEGTVNNPKIQALVQALKSDAVKQYITSTFGGAVVPLF